jgi:hypothetical protein
MPKNSHALPVWISEIFFEDNPRFERRSHRLGIISKVARAIPHAFAFAFCNFASTHPKKNRELHPQPVPPPTGLHLAIDEWPRHPTRSTARGLPHSNGVAAVIDAGNSLEAVSDLVFAMLELHRVSANDAGVIVRLSSVSPDAMDPTAVRNINRAALAFFCEELADERLAVKAQHLGVRSLFSIETATSDTVRLRVRKTAQAPLRTSRIDIGSGSAVQPGYTGVDIIPLDGVEAVYDIDRYGLPFSDSSISHVYTAHFLEHVSDLVFVMNEIHRVCCRDAVVEVHVPTLMGPYAAADPTHVRLFNARTLSYFEAGSEAYAGIEKGFEILEQSVGLSIYARLRVIK